MSKLSTRIILSLLVIKVLMDQPFPQRMEMLLTITIMQPFIMVLVLAMGVAYGLANKVLLLEVKNSLVE